MWCPHPMAACSWQTLVTGCARAGPDLDLSKDLCNHGSFQVELLGGLTWSRTTARTSEAVWAMEMT